jgi:hypothetical protein
MPQLQGWAETGQEVGQAAGEGSGLALCLVPVQQEKGEA